MASEARPYHHGNLRETLLAEAERALEENGVDGLSFRQIARAAGVSHGAPRHHFADRKALLAALAEEGYRRLGIELSSALETAGEDWDAQLDAVSIALIDFAVRHPHLLEVMYTRRHAEAAPAVDAASERAVAIVLGLVERGQAEGRLEDGDVVHVAFVLVSFLNGLAFMINVGAVGYEEATVILREGLRRLAF